MKCLVTGGRGFIGSELFYLLKQRGDTVEISDFCTFNNPDLEIDDWVDSQERLKNPDDHVDVIFHLGAVSRISDSIKNPWLSFETNVMKTVRLLDFIKRTKERIGKDIKLVYAASSCSYGDVTLNPYAASKYSGELACQTFYKTYGVKTAITRFFNVYGGIAYDNPGVIDIFSHNYLHNEPLKITGTGEQKRDFIHVIDVCRALILIAIKGKFEGEIYNVGTGENYSVNDIASWYSGAIIERVPARAGELESTLAEDLSKIHELGWEHNVNLKNYIKFLVNHKLIESLTSEGNEQITII